VAHLFVAEAVFSEPKRRAIRPGLLADPVSRRSSARRRGAASASGSRGCCRSRSPTAVVPTTRYSRRRPRRAWRRRPRWRGHRWHRLPSGRSRRVQVVVDDAQVAQSEVVHGAGGCADVVGLRARTRTMWMRSSSSGSASSSIVKAVAGTAGGVRPCPRFNYTLRLWRLWRMTSHKS